MLRERRGRGITTESAKNTFQDKVERYTQRFPCDRFKNESIRVRSMTYRKANDFKRRALPNTHQNIEVFRSYDIDEDKSSIYAIIDTLYAIPVKFYNIYKITLVIHYNNSDLPTLYPCYYHINQETVNKLKELVDVLFYGAPEIKLYDSDKYTFFAMSEWAQMNIEFVQLTHPGTNIPIKNNRLEDLN